MSKLLTISKTANENYLTRIVKVDNIRKHSNADRLDIITIDGGNIIVGKDSVKIGDIMVYCPVESVLNKDFLSKNNQFEDKELNENKELKSFFNKKGRVRAISLKGEPSRGFLFPPTWFEIWQPELKGTNWLDFVDVEFDFVNNQQFSKKYVVEVSKPRNNSSNKHSNKRNKTIKRFDKLIENQFNFHYDTSFLIKNLHNIQPNDIISITSKFHGTSAIFSNVLINRELKWFEKLLKRFGVRIENREYDTLISSRGVIKNRYINKNATNGFYEIDVWNEAAKLVTPLLAKGETVYAEIVGYLPGSYKFIQKDHDYGCNEGEFDIRVYRVTQTNVDGVVYELSANQVQQWCKNKGLKPVNELYYGRACDLYPHIEQNEEWHTNFFNELKQDKTNFFMELDSPDCKNSVPHEGIVIRNDSNMNLKAFKLKTDRHYGFETEELDKGETDIETLETIIEEE